MEAYLTYKDICKIYSCCKRTAVYRVKEFREAGGKVIMPNGKALVEPNSFRRFMEARS